MARHLCYRFHHNGHAGVVWNVPEGMTEDDALRPIMKEEREFWGDFPRSWGFTFQWCRGDMVDALAMSARIP